MVPRPIASKLGIVTVTTIAIWPDNPCEKTGLAMRETVSQGEMEPKGARRDRQRLTFWLLAEHLACPGIFHRQSRISDSGKSTTRLPDCLRAIPRSFSSTITRTEGPGAQRRAKNAMAARQGSSLGNNGQIAGAIGLCRRSGSMATRAASPRPCANASPSSDAAWIFATASARE